MQGNVSGAFLQLQMVVDTKRISIRDCVFVISYLSLPRKIQLWIWSLALHLVNDITACYHNAWQCTVLCVVCCSAVHLESHINA